MKKNEAMLILGPTGAGKSPLGDALEAEGLAGRRCFHFDFGERLRHAAEHGGKGLSEEDLFFIRDVLEKGALLENETFYIARAILGDFLETRGAGAEDLVVLNGLPRHAGQARDVGEALEIVLVVALECTGETVHARIEGNTGGDRTGRTDDSLAKTSRKLEIYAARTQPLLDHYASAGVTCCRVPVGVETKPADILDLLDDSLLRPGEKR